MPNIRTKSEHLEALLVYFLQCHVCISLACIARVHTSYGRERGEVKDYFFQTEGN